MPQKISETEALRTLRDRLLRQENSALVYFFGALFFAGAAGCPGAAGGS